LWFLGNEFIMKEKSRSKYDFRGEGKPCTIFC
jgi:hypothetical protein